MSFCTVFIRIFVRFCGVRTPLTTPFWMLEVFPLTSSEKRRQRRSAVGRDSLYFVTPKEKEKTSGNQRKAGRV